jgi:medium-chain acyl-[acyl-carrier-protein] hydrolase
VQLPGRENRFVEPAFTRLASIVEALNSALGPELNRPFAFFGHSMGALVGYELARKLESEGRAGPVCLMISAHRAPQFPSRHAPFHILPEGEFISQLAGLGGISKELLANPEMLSLVLPTLRADLTVCETYTWTAEPKLKCPIFAYGGLEDRAVTKDDLAGWQSQTSGDFALKQFPGGHFFLHASQSMLLDQIGQDLQKYRTT